MDSPSLWLGLRLCEEQDGFKPAKYFSIDRVFMWV